jgi:hypothetical protein
MSKTGNAVVSDFVRDAIREKAVRELGALTQRADTFGGIERARDALHTISSDLTSAASAATALATDASVTSRLKKLRKLVEDAYALATEVADTLGVDGQRDSLAASRRSILDALEAAGIDPTSVLESTPGDAQ